MTSPWRPLGSGRFELGEGARFVRGRVQWVDLLRGDLYSWQGDDVEHVQAIARPLGFVEERGGDLVGIAGTGVVRFGREPVLLADTGLDPARYRVNDGTVAPDGSIWFGTMVHDESEADGALWRSDPRTSAIRLMVDDLLIPNGPVFLPGGEMLIADSARGVIFRMDGERPGARSVFAEVADGSPDGMFVSPDGLVWSAVWGGRRIDIYDASGERTGVIPVPVAQPTSVVLTPSGEVAVTSATIGIDALGDLDGSTIMARLADVLP